MSAGRDPRPAELYYEERHAFLSQGDIFRDVPLAYPLPANEIVFEESGGGSRFFLSGPFEAGFAMLLTPTCSMRAQRMPAGTYAHPVRSLAVIRPLTELIEKGVFDKTKLGLMRSYDSLINYMYVPEDVAHDLPESAALLYMTVTLHHEMICDQRIAQLTRTAAQQMQRKLVHFGSSMLIDRHAFDPPMD